MHQISDVMAVLRDLRQVGNGPSEACISRKTAAHSHGNSQLQTFEPNASNIQNGSTTLPRVGSLMVSKAYAIF